MKASVLKTLGRNVRDDCECNCGLETPGFEICCPCYCPCSWCRVTRGQERCCDCPTTTTTTPPPPPPPPPPPSGGGCFPSVAKVGLKNGEIIRMSDLQVGDQVQTGKDCNRHAFILD